MVDALVDAVAAAVSAGGVLFSASLPAAIFGGVALSSGGVDEGDDFAAVVAPGFAGVTALRTGAWMLHGRSPVRPHVTRYESGGWPWCAPFCSPVFGEEGRLHLSDEGETDFFGGYYWGGAQVQVQVLRLRRRMTTKKQQQQQQQKRNAGVSPLRFAPVEMTASLGGKVRRLRSR